MIKVKKYFLWNHVTYNFIVNTGNLSASKIIVFFIRAVVLIAAVPAVPFFNYFEKKRIQKLQLNGYIYYLPYEKNLPFYLPKIRYGVGAGDTIQGEIFYQGDYYEIKFLKSIKKYIKCGDTVLDIGANIGNHTIYFARECKAGFIYSFEPMKETYEILKKNIYLNHLEAKTKVINVGLGSEVCNGDVESYNPNNLGGTRIKKASNGKIKIVSLDSMQIKEKIDFVKIDVEGFECEVLKGAEKTILKSKPIICIEILPNNYNWVLTFMNKLGYIKKESYEGFNYIFIFSGK